MQLYFFFVCRHFWVEGMQHCTILPYMIYQVSGREINSTPCMKLEKSLFLFLIISAG